MKLGFLTHLIRGLSAPAANASTTPTASRPAEKAATPLAPVDGRAAGAMLEAQLGAPVTVAGHTYPAAEVSASFASAASFRGTVAGGLAHFVDVPSEGEGIVAACQRDPGFARDVFALSKAMEAAAYRTQDPSAARGELAHAHAATIERLRMAGAEPKAAPLSAEATRAALREERPLDAEDLALLTSKTRTPSREERDGGAGAVLRRGRPVWRSGASTYWRSDIPLSMPTSIVAAFLLERGERNEARAAARLTAAGVPAALASHVWHRGIDGHALVHFLAERDTAASREALGRVLLEQPDLFGYDTTHWIAAELVDRYERTADPKLVDVLEQALDLPPPNNKLRLQVLDVIEGRSDVQARRMLAKIANDLTPEIHGYDAGCLVDCDESVQSRNRARAHLAVLAQAA